MRQHFFTYLFYTGCLLAALCLPGCQKSEDIKVFPEKPEKELLGYTGGNSSANRVKVVHLYKDTVYTLSEPFIRQSGEQLVIEEGTLIKVVTGGQPVGITIMPGGVMLANGTRNNPIVFTSDEMPGDRDRNWAGITIQGKSVNNSNNVNGDQEDFSGSLIFVRIEFAGLVLKNVGRTTTLEQVQVSYANPQSSYEIDGGTFNARYLISYACGGPADYYMTGGYTGRMQHVLAYRHPFFGSTGNNPFNALSGVFIENNPANPTATPYTHPVISNLTVIGPNAQPGSAPAYHDTFIRGGALVATGNTWFHLRNSVLMGFPNAAWYMDDSATCYGVHYGPSELSYSIFQANDIERAFYLKPGSYLPFVSPEFKSFALQPRFNNRLLSNASEFAWKDAFNYNAPDPMPASNSPVLQGANFDGPLYNVFFKVNYIGALGTDNWLQGWANFTPLKTSYNEPG